MKTEESGKELKNFLKEHREYKLPVFLQVGVHKIILSRQGKMVASVKRGEF